jgi:hypothetical protein
MGYGDVAILFVIGCWNVPFPPRAGLRALHSDR